MIPFCVFSQSFPKRKYYDSTLLLKALSRYHTDSMQRISAGGLRPGLNLTTDIKNKLLQLLKRDWTPQEIRSKLDRGYKEHFERLYLDWILTTAKGIKDREKMVYDSVYKKQLAAQVISKDVPKKVAENFAKEQAKKVSIKYRVVYDSVYRRMYDSAVNIFKSVKEQEIKEAPVQDEILFFVSLANLKEAIPIIKREMKSGYKPPFDVETAEIALAGLGESEYLAKVLKRHQDYVKRRIWISEEMVKDATALETIIETQESMALMADWMDTTHTYQQASEVRNDPNAVVRYQSAGLVPNLLTVIKNKDFIEGYQKVQPTNQPVNYMDDYNVTKEHILFIRNWLLANKGKYEFW